MPQVNDNTTGSAYWRSLEEYSSAPEVREMLKQEFAGYDPDDVLSVSRRRFVQIMAASLSLAGLTLSGCRRWPQEKLAPFASRPAGSTPGVPTHYASMIERGGIANGVLVNSFDGRPIKVEGNPLHPGSLGATDAFTQASILQMYDPYRLREVRKGKDAGAKSNWAGYKSFSDELVSKIKAAPASFAVLSECSSSPSLKRMKAGLLAAFPGAKWYEYEPLNRDNEVQGAKLAFEKPVRAQYRLDKAETIVCFDSDLLGNHPNQVRHAHDWALGRKSADEGRMSRLYAVESTMTITGSVADHRLPIRSAQVGAIVQAVAQHLKLMPGSPSLKSDAEVAFVDAVVKDLDRSRGKSLVVAGSGQPPQVHAICWAINDVLGNIGHTVEVTEEPEVLGGSNNSRFEDISQLSSFIESGQVKHLLILGGNPAYDAPADLDFAGKLAKLESAAHLTEYSNETSKLCAWQLPKANYLECWGDGRSWDGTLSVQQPLILPIARKGSESKSPIELIAAMLGESTTDGYTIVRQTLAQVLPTVGFEAAWRKTLHEGLVADSAYAPLTARPKKANLEAPKLDDAQGYELTFQADPSVYDGRFADNGWLQETPGPMTKMTWDNAALINIADAKGLGLKNGDLVNITLGDKTLKIAAYLMPGQAKGSIALPLGYGRPGAGPVGKLVGFNTYTLRNSTRPHFARDAKVAATGESYELALTQGHHLIDNIGASMTDTRVGTKGVSGLIIKEATFDHYKQNPKKAWKAPGEHEGVSLQLWDSPYMTPAKREGGPEAFNNPHAWGMTIDMNACIGCNACVVACQAENNIPVVGKDMVLMSREMNWLRIDRYFKNDRKADPDAENPEVIHQPMMCQQCENAPCEQVCPVAATVHDAEGLNVMVYNRCIGTRYCSNNCPYKVRRFNYFDFHSKDPRGRAKPWIPMNPLDAFPDREQELRIDKIKRMVYNPDVTVRMRGVMEKCSYCVQRIKRNTIEAKNLWARGERDKPTVDDGAIVTACQQSCPTQAIVFGDLNDANSDVTKSQQSPRAYMVLEELNTRARSKYLAKLRNPNPALASTGGGGHEPSHPASETQGAHS